MGYETSPDRIRAFLDEVIAGEISLQEARELTTQTRKDLRLLSLSYDEIFAALTLHDETLRAKISADVKSKQETLRRVQARRNGAETETA